jgi:hypothetical protein
MSAKFDDIKDALKVIGSINKAIEDKQAPTPEKVELCEEYINALSVIGLIASAQAVEESLNRWCGLLINA